VQPLRPEPYPSPPRWREGGLVGGAFAAILVCALAFSAISVVELGRARREVVERSYVAERSTLLVGRIGRSVSRLRSTVLEALTEPAGDVDRAVRRLAELGAVLEQDLAALDPLLGRSERSKWDHVRPQVEGLRDALDEALRLIAAGANERAEELLDEAATLSHALQGRLDVLMRQNEAESDLQLAAADRRLERTWWIEIALGLAMALATLTTWLVVRRLLARQRRELARHVERIEQANADLDAFAERIAHDVRNLLAPLSAGAQLLRDRSDPEVVDYVAGELERSARRADRQLCGLLAFSRAGRAEDAASAPVDATCREALDDLRAEAQGAGAEIETRIDDLSVRMHPGLLHQVLSNLLGNAFKHVAGRDVRRVRVAARAVDGSCELEVEDTGEGIPAAACERVFEPFYRVPGNDRPGTGIGLATVDRIVAAHGGRIELSSTPGVGTRFRIRLPLANTPETPRPEGAREDGRAGPNVADRVRPGGRGRP
jgi:signal transduction histidine kinase